MLLAQGPGLQSVELDPSFFQLPTQFRASQARLITKQGWTLQE